MLIVKFCYFIFFFLDIQVDDNVSQTSSIYLNSEAV